MPFRDPEKRRAYQREWRRCYEKAQPKKRKQRKKWRHGLVFFDTWTHCMFGMFTAKPCLRKPRWRNGAWRACDAHRHPTDIPIG